MIESSDIAVLLDGTSSYQEFGGRDKPVDANLKNVNKELLQTSCTTMAHLKNSQSKDVRGRLCRDCAKVEQGVVRGLYGGCEGGGGSELVQEAIL